MCFGHEAGSHAAITNKQTQKQWNWEKLFPTKSLQLPLLTTLSIVPAGKERIFKGTKLHFCRAGDEGYIGAERQ